MASSSSASCFSSKEIELIPLVGATSSVWKHFGFPAVDGKHN